MMIIPSVLYKYQRVNANSLVNLKTHAIYMASPLGFNDPYDCALGSVMHEVTDSELDRIVSYCAKQVDVPVSIKQQLSSFNKIDLKAVFLKGSKSAIEQQVQQFLKRNGVACFTERKDNLLMWAHYGGCYKGFCLEFRTHFYPFNKMRMVQYTPEIPHINIASCLIENDFDHITDLYCTKSADWQYEKEWRLIHQEAETSYIYPVEALRAVYFGPNIDMKDVDTIASILRAQNPSVELWMGKLSKTQFKVSVVRLTNCIDVRQE